MFIGSSSEGLEFARALQSELKDVCLPTIWSQGVFGSHGLSGTLEELVASLDKWDFAVLVATPDDLVETRGQTGPIARDNVVLELGLLCGYLGRERVYLLTPNDAEIRVPSDLAGIARLDFKYEVAASDRRASLGPAATTLRTSIYALGPRARPAASQEWWHRAMLRANDVLATLALQKTQPKSAAEADGKGVLEVLHSLFSEREPSIVVTWLRPTEGDRRLRVHTQFGQPQQEDHYAYSLGEGLAGTVWANGTPDVHSPSNPSPRWLARPNCENAAYLCAPVRGQGDDLGVIAVGSDVGFAIDSSDLPLVQIFARALCMEVAL